MKVTYDNGKELEITPLNVRDTKSNNFHGWECDAGLTYVFINELGDVYPCTRLHDNKKSTQKIGNLFDDEPLNLQKTICSVSACHCGREINLDKTAPANGPELVPTRQL
jgi:MoaA/NifB/PqqE/SkfB family radical SAM enzyme